LTIQTILKLKEMKSRNMILSAIVFSMTILSYSANAQVNKEQQDSAQNRMPEHHMQHPKTDHVMMHEGKMMVMKDGKMMPMENGMTLKNGTKCMTDGTCITNDGKKTMMKEGEMMDMNGKMMMVLIKDDKSIKE